MKKKTTKLDVAVLSLFHEGNVMNVSQTTAQIHTMPEFRSTSTLSVRAVVLQLEKKGLLERETKSGVTRFRFHKSSGRGRFTVAERRDSVVTRHKWGMADGRFTVVARGREIYHDGEPYILVGCHVKAGDPDKLVERLCALLNSTPDS